MLSTLRIYNFVLLP